ncbi:hypothetical protein QT972_25450 [Microcoleus sp. herbarium7]|uniref:hypothetical protein n=1 Tax=Microcoleus sp. herbarium7 TaxID=3055435 RepID=UPI002FD5B410
MTQEQGYFDQKLAAVIGLEEAVIFNKLQWCVENPQMGGTIAHDGLKMIRNPIACTNPRKLNKSHGKLIDWLGNFTWATPGKLRRIFARLEAIGLVIVRKLRAHTWDQCKYYSIDYKKLAELLKGAPLSICRKPINGSDGNDHIDLMIADKSYQNTFSDIPLQFIEREGAFEKNKIVIEEEKENQAEEEDSSQEVKGKWQEPVQQKVICTPINQKEDFWVNQEIKKLDQSSATVESAKTKVESASIKVESAKAKVEFAYSKVVSAPECDENELKEFQEQLKAYGVKSGKKNPSGWAYTIAHNMTRYGVPSPYWDEFKAGVAIGTGDRREWESEPGVPCEAVLQCLKERFLSKAGTTPAEAAIQVGRQLESPRQMEILWQAIKDRVVFLRDECRRLAKVGVQYPALDPWLTPKRKASSEDAVSALQELHQYQTPQLQLCQPETLTIASEEFRRETQGRLNALTTVTESCTAPELELSEEECRANIATLSAMYRDGKKLEQTKAKIERAIALTEMQAALPAALQPARYEVEQVLLPEPPVEDVATEEEDPDFDWPVVEPKAEAGIPAQAKAEIAKALSKFSVRRTKKQAILDANSAEVSEALGIPVSELPINKKQPIPSSADGTAAYLASLEIVAGDVW